MNLKSKLTRRYAGISGIALLALIVVIAVGAAHVPSEVAGGSATAEKFEPEQVHLSWSTNDVYHTMTVMWWTESPGRDRVVYDTASHELPKKYAYRADGIHFQIAPEVDRHGEPIETKFEGWYHETELTGLEPGTTYYFRVGGPGGYSQEWSFRTIGLDQNVKFVMGGDSRSPYAAYEIKSAPTAISNWPIARDWVTTGAAGEDPDFIVFGGDMVNEGRKQGDWNDWFDSMQECLVKDGRMIPIVAVIGNHEMGAYPDVESTYEWFKGVFANPGNELWFSLDFPNLHLTALSTTGGCTATWWEPALEEAVAQVEWLESDLAGSDAEWKVVAFHVPYYSGFVTGTGYASEPFLKYWAPILEDPAYGVDLVIGGHVHNYLRSWPMRTTSVEEVTVDLPWTEVGYLAHYELLRDSSAGVTYMVQGTWGAPTDPYVKGTECDIRDFMASASARPSYTVAELIGDGLHFVTKDISGEVLDEATLHYTTKKFPVPEYEYVI